MKNNLKLLATCFSLSLLVGCATNGGNSKEYSGFLNDYSNLKSDKDSSGNFRRYVNNNVDLSTYHSIIIDRVDFYPTPRATKQVSAKVLMEIANYIDQQLSKAAGNVIKVVSQPGPGVARLRFAITAVAPETRDLKAYEYVPIAFILTNIKGRGQAATIQIEHMALDSVTGELLVTSVRQGQGAKLDSDETLLTLNDLRPLLDKWIEASVSNLKNFVK